MKITLDCNVAAKCWTATFEGGGDWGAQPLPLAFTTEARLSDVARDMHARFPQALIFYRNKLGHRTHCGF